jgi:hypothetical protein
MPSPAGAHPSSPRIAARVGARADRASAMFGTVGRAPQDELYRTERAARTPAC